MERKIGKIFEHNGEWYQCVEGGTCSECSFRHIDCDISNIGDCTDKRTDGETVIFKKLEKIGEPHWIGKRLMQTYDLFTEAIPPLGIECFSIWHEDLTIELEIKQNQEDVGTRKIKLSGNDVDYLQDKLEAILHDCNCMEQAENISDSFFSYFERENESDCKNLSPFNLESVKAGKPVCTRNGRKARIILFDLKDRNYPIAAAVQDNDEDESIRTYTTEGIYEKGKISGLDLMMLPEKHEGWINIFKNKDGYYFTKGVFSSKEFARNNEANYPQAIVATVKINWEE